MNKPLKRSPHLIQLSKEHHHTLLFCWKIRQGLKRKVDPKRIVPYVEYFWKTHLRSHFAGENLFFQKCTDPMVTRAYKEHESIKVAVQQLEKVQVAELSQALGEIADLVDQHIRFEERILFPLLEQAIPASTLGQVAAALASIKDVPIVDLYADEFWLPIQNASDDH